MVIIFHIQKKLFTWVSVMYLLFAIKIQLLAQVILLHLYPKNTKLLIGSCKYNNRFPNISEAKIGNSVLYAYSEIAVKSNTLGLNLSLINPVEVSINTIK